MAKTTAMGMDSNWSAQSDMRTLVEAQMIRNDKKRFAAAKKAALKQAEDLEGVFETPADEAKETD